MSTHIKPSNKLPKRFLWRVISPYKSVTNCKAAEQLEHPKQPTKPQNITETTEKALKKMGKLFKIFITNRFHLSRNLIFK